MALTWCKVPLAETVSEFESDSESKSLACPSICPICPCDRLIAIKCECQFVCGVRWLNEERWRGAVGGWGGTIPQGTLRERIRNSSIEMKSYVYLTISLISVYLNVPLL